MQPHQWILLYGNRRAEPRLCLIVSAVRQADQQWSEFEKKAWKIFSPLKVPCRILRFPKNFEPPFLFSDGKKTTQTTPQTLYDDLFAPFAIEKARQRKPKAINDRISSHYHHWQRQNLAAETIVSDFDLIEYTPDFFPIRIFELKRSFIEVEKWKPFRRDYPNFSLLANAFAEKTRIYIVYNRFTKNPPHDDISQLALFRVLKHKNNTLKIYPFYIQNAHSHIYTFRQIFARPQNTKT